MRKSTSPKSTRRALALALGCTLGAAAGTAGANPLGPQVVNGGATFANPAAGVLEVTNTPGAIINWQSFGIGASETTRFIQQSAQSAVLNRVVGGVPSEILGNLLSNGRVFLVNPNGILFGRNAVVDTAGLVASTLSIQDADFISGRLKFDGGPESGAIRNEGFIKAAPGGNVLVIAPTIENTGIIQADGGKLMLAAGRSVTLVSLDSDYVTFEVQAPSDQVLNLGELLARGGAARIFAGSIRQAGVVSADSVGVDAAGVVELRASSRVALESASRTTASGGTAADGGSVIVEARSAEGTAPAEIAHEGTVDASGVNGGSVTLAGDLITSTGTVSARGGNAGGAVSMTARDSLLLSGMSRVRVDGGSGQGGSATLDGGMNLNASTIVEASGDRGGTIHVLGDSVQLVGASLDARGEHGGGDVRIGGGRAGGEGLKASNVTAVDRLTLVRADATGDGDGGTAVLWSAGDTHFSGTITARGGMTGGDGGLIEVSGRSIYNLGRIDLSAVAGNGGTLVLDPVLITIQAGSIINTTGFADPTNSEGSSFGSDFNCFAAGSITSCGSGADRILFYVPLDDVNGVADSGAVYLFDLQTGALVSSLIGTHAGDQVGAGGLYDFDECCLSLPGMPDGTVVLSHPFYNNDGGALTPFNVISGMGIGTAVSDGSVPGVAANSIVGNPGDFITSSFFDVDALPGKTVMFNEDALGGRGAVTVLNSASLTFAATGGFGMVSAANSLVGVATTDHVGSAGAFQISSGNYYIRSPDFNSFGGALTFFNAGTTPVGTVSNANSILGNAGDQLASGFFQYLDANTLAMATPDFGGGRGAVTVVNPTTGQFKAGGGFGFIGSGNSLVGSATTDAVGNGGVTFLGGNGYYIESPDFNSLGGALTFISPTVIPVGVVSASNSIMGNAGEGLGSGGIVNSIVGVQLLRTPGFGVDLGAVTAIDPATGQFKTGGFGFIGATNSLVGATSGDQVGSDGFIQIGTSAGYIYSPSWDGGRGALTFFSSTALPVGIVSDGVVTPTANSITGAFGSDCLGCRGIFTPFTFGGVAGRVVILTDTFNVDAGAITVTDATTGEFAVGGGFGNVGGANSLIGGGGDRLGSSGVEWAFDEFGSITGTFVKSPLFNGSAGAFTFVSANPVDPVPFGAVNGANGASIFGANPSDRIGDVSFGGTFDTFSVPGYTVILSPHYNGDRGAITVLDSTTGRFAASALFGMVDASGCPGASSTCNSAVGSVAGDLVGDGGLFPDFNGRAFVFSPGWNSSGGALTFLEPGAVAPAVIPLGQVGTGNSIVGAPGDLLGSNGVDMFSLSGLTIVLSPFAAFNAGAITVLDSATGQFAVGGGFGAISTSNSLVGVIDSFASLPEDRIGSGDIEVLPSGTAMVTSPFFNESAGALTFIRSGSVPFGLLTTASPTAFSIAGDQPGAHLGSNAGGSDFIYTSEDLESLISAQGGGFFFPTRFDGDLVVLSPDAFNGKGAITVLDDTTGQFTVSGTYGALDVSGCPGAGATCNSLAGATANATVQGDHLGSGGIVGLASGHVLVRSLEFNKGAGTVGGGALTFLDNAAAPLTGIADGTNSIIGANGANLLGSLTIDQFTLFGKLILRNSNYDSGRGVVTVLDAATGQFAVGGGFGAITSVNSLLGVNPDVVGPPAATGDRVGSGGVQFVAFNGVESLFAVRSPLFNGSAGALTFFTESNLPFGNVDSTNSVFGATPGDQFGSGNFTNLGTRTLVLSPNFGGNLGAITAIDNTTGAFAAGGLFGAVDVSDCSGGASATCNSLVGALAGDRIGSGGFATGNLIDSPTWNGSAGALTFVSDASIPVGVLSSANIAATPAAFQTIAGANPNDRLGYNQFSSRQVNAFSIGGKTLVFSNQFNGGDGAITMLEQATGQFTVGGGFGFIGQANSLVGRPTATPKDAIGNNGAFGSIITLSGSSNFLLRNSSYGNGAGALTWVDPALGIAGIIGSGNSLVGSTAFDNIGSFGTSVIGNGMYAVFSPSWNNGGSAAGAGAITFGSVATGVRGTVDASNSLVGTLAGDSVGNQGNSFLSLGTTGNRYYRVPNWNNRAGALVLFGNGAAPPVGAVSATNALVGSTGALTGSDVDGVGNATIQVLFGDKLLVFVPGWNNGAAVDAGAIVMGTTAGVVGSISAANALIGTSTNDRVGISNGLLTNVGSGNFVLRTPTWKAGAGAVTFLSPTSIPVGAISSANSFVGATAGDGIGSIVSQLQSTQIGGVATVTRFYISAPLWDNGTVVDAGAFTIGDSVAGIVGTPSALLSLVGTHEGDMVGSGGLVFDASRIVDRVFVPGSGNFVLRSPSFNGMAGAITYVKPASGAVGAVDDTNSLIGETAGDQIGSRAVIGLGNDRFLVISPEATVNGRAQAGRFDIINGPAVPGSNVASVALGATGPTKLGALDIAAFLSGGGNLVLQATEDILVEAGADILATAGVLTLQAGRSLILKSSVFARGLALHATDATDTATGSIEILADLAPVRVGAEELSVKAIDLFLQGGNVDNAFAALIGIDSFKFDVQAIELVGGTAANTDAVIVSFADELTLPADCIGCTKLDGDPFENGATQTGIFVPTNNRAAIDRLFTLGKADEVPGQEQSQEEAEEERKKEEEARKAKCK